MLHVLSRQDMHSGLGCTLKGFWMFTREVQVRYKGAAAAKRPAGARPRRRAVGFLKLNPRPSICFPAQVRLMEQLQASGLQAPDIAGALRLRPQAAPLDASEVLVDLRSDTALHWLNSLSIATRLQLPHEIGLYARALVFPPCLLSR